MLGASAIDNSCPKLGNINSFGQSWASGLSACSLESRFPDISLTTVAGIFRGKVIMYVSEGKQLDVFYQFFKLSSNEFKI